MSRIRSIVIGFLVLLMGAVGCSSLPSDGDDLTIYLVRHAEKLKNAKNPDLSLAGKIRAKQLVDVLGEAGIRKIYSTDYARTQQTAAPLADHLGLEVLSYDPWKLEELANQLKQERGAILVVGHSNTIPALAVYLGGHAGEKIHEPTEYDRLYIIKIDATGAVTSRIDRFGTRYIQEGTK